MGSITFSIHPHPIPSQSHCDPEAVSSDVKGLNGKDKSGKQIISEADQWNGMEWGR